MKHHFRVIQGCPCPERIAPYIFLVLQGAQVNSIYRGADAEKILHAHGHQSQAELFNGWIQHLPGYLPANPPGFSTHELKSDEVAYPSIPKGADLHWWMQGFDVNDSEVDAIERQAALRGWELFRPYDTGSEYHHLNFKTEPRANRSGQVKVSWLRILRARNSLPRS